MIATTAITGVVLAGGRGSRMGGVDKGLETFRDEPLVAHVLRRLAPQVGAVAINANRNLEAYARFGVPVWPDTLPGHPGPLAGFLAALAQCPTPYLLTVPCDSPLFPDTLARRLADELEAEDADIAMAATFELDGLRAQPVFCLMRSSLRQSLADFIASGRRRVDAWTACHRCVVVPFADAWAFAGANTPSELKRLFLYSES